MFNDRKYFSDNKEKSKPLRKRIHEIVYSEKAGERNNPSSLLPNDRSVANQQNMVEHFNNFFISIEKSHQETIPLARKHYTQYLKAAKKT